ncbi:MAG: cupin domain-containing protein [Terriglobales bacterium]
MTRRELSLSLPLAIAALYAGGSATTLEAAVRGVRGGGPAQDAIETLIQEPLAKMAHPVVSMITLTMAPGSRSAPHKHTGPVFAYLLEGEIENQVDPEPPKRYRPGGFFYEPPMHVHRVMRNLSKTKIAKLLITQVGEKGVPFTIPLK